MSDTTKKIVLGICLLSYMGFLYFVTSSVRLHSLSDVNHLELPECKCVDFRKIDLETD
jgi:hypothetical protein